MKNKTIILLLFYTGLLLTAYIVVLGGCSSGSKQTPVPTISRSPSPTHTAAPSLSPSPTISPARTYSPISPSPSPVPTPRWTDISGNISPSREIYDQGYVQVKFISTAEGWLTTRDNKILHTTDGGDSWEVQSDFSAYFSDSGSLWGIQFIGNYGWLIARDGSGFDPLWTTDDYGRHWTRNTNIYGGCYTAYFIDSLEGWVTGDKTIDYIQHTTDGGATWSSQEVEGTPTDDAYFQINSMCFTGNDGWMVARVGTATPEPIMLHTADMGLTMWRTVEVSTATRPFPTNLMYSIAFSDQDHGYAVGAFGLILMTTDGGHTWTNISNSVVDALAGIAIIDTHEAWIGGGVDKKILHVIDGNITTVRVPTSSIDSINFVDSTHGWAVGYYNNYGIYLPKILKYCLP